MKIKKWNGSAWIQDYPEVTVSKIIATGTPSSSTFLCGDGSWQTVSVSGSFLPLSGGTLTGILNLTNADIGLSPGYAVALSGSSDSTHRIFHDASSDYDVISHSTGFQLRHFQTGNQLTLVGSTGALGIGTTDPSRKLDVNGSSRFRDTMFFGASDSEGLISWNANGFVILGESGKGMAFGANGVNNHMYINTSGNVGIGTLSPANKLHIQDGDLRLFNTGGANPSIFLSNYNVSTSYPQVALVQSDAGLYGGNFSIQTKPNGASTNPLSTRLFVQHDGSVGINTTSPSSNYKLDVNGETILRNWMTFNNNAFFGLYSPNNGAHFYPNNASYGAWRVAGSRNTYNGIEFDTSGGNVSLMVQMGGNTTGFHNNSYGWQFYWESGSLQVAKNNNGGGPIARVHDNSNLTFSLSGTTLTITRA
jgi:hypothetical protein